MGVRILKVPAALVASIMATGVHGFDPIDIPRDLEILDVRADWDPFLSIELLVSSQAWEDKPDRKKKGDWNSAEPWNATFSRRVPFESEAVRTLASLLKLNPNPPEATRDSLVTAVAPDVYVHTTPQLAEAILQAKASAERAREAE